MADRPAVIELAGIFADDDQGLPAVEAVNLNVHAGEIVRVAGISGTGNALSNSITGNNAANSLSGLAGRDLLLGKDASDTLSGGDGADTIFGGNGDDLAFGLAVDAAGNWSGDLPDLRHR